MIFSNELRNNHSYGHGGHAPLYAMCWVTHIAIFELYSLTLVERIRNNPSIHHQTSSSDGVGEITGVMDSHGLLTAAARLQWPFGHLDRFGPCIPYHRERVSIYDEPTTSKT
jgi:hypothetical protein